MTDNNKADNLETVTFEVDEDIAREAEVVLRKQGYTLEDASVMFMRWCAENPDEAKETIQEWLHEDKTLSEIKLIEGEENSNG